MSIMDSGDLRNLKDFLLLYNKISEDCFKKCVYNMTQRTLDTEEQSCITTCTQKHVNVNHKTMELFAEINPVFQKRKVEEHEIELRKLQAEAEANNANANSAIPNATTATATPSENTNIAATTES